MTLTAKHVLVTGATSGIGQAAALELACQGAIVTLMARSAERARASANFIERQCGYRPDYIIADFNDLSSVRDGAARFLEGNRKLDVLLNNAGLINTRRLLSADGFEQTFAVDHLAPFLLTGLLLPRLLDSVAGRIVNVASDAHRFCRGIQFDDLHWERQPYKTFKVYGHAKLANILFTAELARRLRSTKLTVNCLHPGAVATGMGKNNKGLASKIMPTLLKPFFRTPQRGAETAVYLSANQDVTGCSGGYYVDKKLVAPKAWARDESEAARLWSVSEALTRFQYPAQVN